MAGTGMVPVSYRYQHHYVPLLFMIIFSYCRNTYTPEDMTEAVRLVIQEGYSVSQACLVINEVIYFFLVPVLIR